MAGIVLQPAKIASGVYVQVSAAPAPNLHFSQATASASEPLTEAQQAKRLFGWTPEISFFRFAFRAFLAYSVAVLAILTGVS